MASFFALFPLKKKSTPPRTTVLQLNLSPSALSPLCFVDNSELGQHQGKSCSNKITSDVYNLNQRNTALLVTTVWQRIPPATADQATFVNQPDTVLFRSQTKSLSSPLNIWVWSFLDTIIYSFYFNQAFVIVIFRVLGEDCWAPPHRSLSIAW